MGKSKRKSAGERADKRAFSQIEAAGWSLTAVREGGVGRFVARKRRIEDDHSESYLYESSYTLVALATQVERREREEQR